MAQWKTWSFISRKGIQVIASKLLFDESEGKTNQLKIKRICFNEVLINMILKILSCQKNKLDR